MPAKKHWDFESQKAVGNIGVKLLTHYFEVEGTPVYDVTDETKWRERDVDLIVGGATVEVKTDTHTTDSLFLELTSAGKPGCVIQSRADYWAVVYPVLKRFYWIALPELVHWLLKHSSEYPPIVLRSQAGKRQWEVMGIAVPVADLVAAGVSVEQYKLEGV